MGSRERAGVYRKATREYSRKMVTYEPGGGATPQAQLAGTLILDLPPPEHCGMNSVRASGVTAA